MSKEIFQIDHNNVKAPATSFTLTESEIKKYNGIAFDADVDVSFDSGSQSFPIKAGVPMLLPVNFTTIETSVLTKLFLGI